MGKEYNEDGQLENEGLFHNGELLNGKVYSPEKDSYEGEYLAGEKHGKGKEYRYDINIIEFEVEYYFGEKKQGIKYDKEGNKKFEGEYLNDQYWKGIKYKKGKFVFDGEFQEKKEWTGKILKYDDEGELKYEGNYLYGKKHGKGKKYKNKKLKFEGEYYYGKKWKGKF